MGVSGTCHMHLQNKLYLQAAGESLRDGHQAAVLFLVFKNLSRVNYTFLLFFKIYIDSIFIQEDSKWHTIFFYINIGETIKNLSRARRVTVMSASIPPLSVNICV